MCVRVGKDTREKKVCEAWFTHTHTTYVCAIVFLQVLDRERGWESLCSNKEANSSECHKRQRVHHRCRHREPKKESGAKDGSFPFFPLLLSPIFLLLALTFFFLTFFSLCLLPLQPPPASSASRSRLWDFNLQQKKKEQKFKSTTTFGLRETTGQACSCVTCF